MFSAQTANTSSNLRESLGCNQSIYRQCIHEAHANSKFTLFGQGQL